MDQITLLVIGMAGTFIVSLIGGLAWMHHVFATHNAVAEVKKDLNERLDRMEERIMNALEKIERKL